MGWYLANEKRQNFLFAVYLVVVKLTSVQQDLTCEVILFNEIVREASSTKACDLR